MNKIKSGYHWLLTIISILIYAIFICSVVYNYAYFFGLGISLSQIPISVSDVINSALSWSPIVLGAAIFEIFILVMIFPYHRYKNKEHTSHFLKNGELTEKIQSLVNTVINFVVIVSLVTLLLIGQVDNSLSNMFLIIVSLLFLAFIRFMRNKKMSRLKKIRRIFVVIFMSIMMLGAVFLLGYDASANKLIQKTPDGSIYLKNDPLKKLPINILRNLDKGVIVIKMSDMQATFIPWDEIYSIDERITKTQFEGLLHKFNALRQKLESGSNSRPHVYDAR